LTDHLENPCGNEGERGNFLIRVKWVGSIKNEDEGGLFDTLGVQRRNQDRRCSVARRKIGIKKGIKNVGFSEKLTKKSERKSREEQPLRGKGHFLSL